MIGGGELTRGLEAAQKGSLIGLYKKAAKIFYVIFRDKFEVANWEYVGAFMYVDNEQKSNLISLKFVLFQITHYKIMFLSNFFN